MDTTSRGTHPTRAGRVYHADRVWTGGAVAADVTITTERGAVTHVETAMAPPAEAHRLTGFVIPGLVNAHSHVFHRVLRGRVERLGGDFWTWREHMYAIAERLDPDTYRTLASAVFAEMALAGITAVGEFHYLHHPPEGGRYGDPNAMGNALVEAATTAGLRLTLLDTCYLSAGFGRKPAGVQERFSDGTATAWVDRASRLDGHDLARVGAAIHSVRAVGPADAQIVATWASAHDRPLHFHLSEQPAENEACLAATGLTPTGLLETVGALGPDSSAVHGTHLTNADVGLLAATGTGVCLCPTTERMLGDGIGRASRLIEAGVSVSVGSDSHAVIDLLEEARLVDLQERLATGTGPGREPSALLEAATINGAAALGWPNGGISVGGLADFVAVDLDTVRTAGIDDPLAAVVYGATAADVRSVVIGGELVVDEGEYLRSDDPAGELAAAVRSVTDA